MFFGEIKGEDLWTSKMHKARSQTYTRRQRNDSDWFFFFQTNFSCKFQNKSLPSWTGSKGTINISPRGHNSPRYSYVQRGWSHQLSVQQSRDSPRHFPSLLTPLQEAHGADVDAELLIPAANVHGGNIHNGKSCCFLCPVLKHGLAPVAICLLLKR